MKKQIGIYSALLVALLAASPAGAQATNDAPSIIPRAKPATFDREGISTGDSARKAIDQFGACVLGRRHKPVLKALALPSGSEAQSKELGSLGVKECIASGEMNFGAFTFRGSLYTALVRAQFGRKPASLGSEPADYTKQPPPGGGSPPIPQVADLLNFASCVVHKDQEDSRNAILTTAGSPPEDAALAALSKVYGQCASADQKLTFSKGELIGLLAETYYREGITAAQGSATP